MPYFELYTEQHRALSGNVGLKAAEIYRIAARRDGRPT